MLEVLLMHPNFPLHEFLTIQYFWALASILKQVLIIIFSIDPTRSIGQLGSFANARRQGELRHKNDRHLWPKHLSIHVHLHNNLLEPLSQGCQCTDFCSGYPNLPSRSEHSNWGKYTYKWCNNKVKTAREISTLGEGDYAQWKNAKKL